MLVRYSSPTLSILFANLHGPHRANERCLIDEWWKTTKQLLHRHRRQSHLVVGGDCNAALGSVTSPHIGEVWPEDEDPAGEHLHDIARTFGLYFPATMPECHCGPSYTYIQKNGGQKCRPDFLAIPVEWAHGQVTSFSDPEIHAGHSTPDHIAARVDIAAWFRTARSQASLGRRVIRTADITDPANHAAISRVLASVPQVSWTTSVHAHAAIITDHVQRGLQRLASTHPAKPHHPYLTEPTWELQREVTAARRNLHRLTFIMERSDLACGFRAWASKLTLREATKGGGRWLAQAQRAHHDLQVGLEDRCKQLKKACRADRDAFISGLAQTISTAPSKEAYQAYHRVLAHRRKKAHRLDPLPRIKLANGEVCADQVQTAQRWREHFSALEAGRDVTFSALASAALKKGNMPSGPHPENIEALPTLPDLRRVLASAKSGKAPGMDSIPQELGRHFSRETAALLHPLLVKVLWGGVEPIGFKGGRAVVLYKGRGSTSCCASYRSILLTPGWAKTFHQTMRPAIRKVFEETAPSMQIGGRRGCAVTFGSHVLRALQRQATLSNRPCYILFADISAAFYSALVQFIAQQGASVCASDIARALEGLACPEEVKCDRC